MHAHGVIDEVVNPRYSSTAPSISSAGHNCNIPVNIQTPVAIVPWEGRRAPVGYIVQCGFCRAYWQVKSRRVPLGEPDLVWQEITSVRAHWYSRPVDPAPDLVFNTDEAWKLPDVTNWDWSGGNKPKRPDGQPWWQLDFPQLRATDSSQCSSVCTNRWKPLGSSNWLPAAGQCELLDEHAGFHEARSIAGGPTGW